ncbi:unnamed protein product [Peronospora belbahrii]|uniref:Uncharacterized protein n=1 Tax=Peronospora belbahrii TaxID=622444 RepID=A0ABN8CP46_9STRA|nr:unnamed protein product [Peronospora belbahrii]
MKKPISTMKSCNLVILPLYYGWQHVDEFIRAIETARADAEAPGAESLPTDPLALPAVVTAKRFKEAVIDYIKPQENAARLGTSCLVGTLPESVTVGCTSCVLWIDNPWVKRMIAFGVGQTYTANRAMCVHASRSSRECIKVTPRLNPTSLWG